MRKADDYLYEKDDFTKEMKSASLQEKNKSEAKGAFAHKDIMLRGWKALCVVVLALLFCCCWVFGYVPQMTMEYQWKGNLAVTVFYLVVMVVFTRIYHGYSVGMIPMGELVYSQGLALLLSNGVAYALAFFLCEKLVSIVPIVLLLAVQILFVFFWATAAYWLEAKMSPMEDVVIIYRDQREMEKVFAMRHFAKKYRVVETVERPTGFRDAIPALEHVRTAFIIGVDANVRNGIVKYCIDEGIETYIVPKIGDILVRGAKVQLSGGEIFMQVSRPKLSPEYLILKRAIDIVVSLVCLIVTSPITLVTAIAIKAYDKGPVFYSQIRLTKNGRTFRIWKFRTMRVDAEKDGVARLATNNDDRITPVGHIIRRYRIDELPQCINILRGDMTIVGPRPERPEIAEQYESEMPAFSLRLQVKAGLTGYAQIYGRYNSEPYEKLQMDLMYIHRMSLVEDMRLMLSTVKILFMKESTKGIEQGSVTASAEQRQECGL